MFDTARPRSISRPTRNPYLARRDDGPRPCNLCARRFRSAPLCIVCSANVPFLASEWLLCISRKSCFITQPRSTAAVQVNKTASIQCPDSSGPARQYIKGLQKCKPFLFSAVLCGNDVPRTVNLSVARSGRRDSHQPLRAVCNRPKGLLQ